LFEIFIKKKNKSIKSNDNDGNEDVMNHFIKLLDCMKIVLKVIVQPVVLYKKKLNNNIDCSTVNVLLMWAVRSLCM